MQAPSTLQRYFADLAHLASAIPTATVQRSIGLAEVAAARAGAQPRPVWLAVFTKALAFVAGAHAELRQVWQPLPRPRIYEHPFAVAAVAVEREWDEKVPALWARLRNPGQLGLQELGALLSRFKEEPAERVGQLRRLQSPSRWPRLLRRLAWSRGTLWSGNRRARRFGTFAVASVGGLGSELIDPVYPATTVLTFGTIVSGGVDLRLKFDTRVLTPWTAARILQDVECALRWEMTMGMRYFQRLHAAFEPLTKGVRPLCRDGPKGASHKGA